MLYNFLTYINSTGTDTTYFNVAYYVSNNLHKVVKMNLEELADACYVSQATISRFCRHLGFDNFNHFKQECQLSISDGERRIRELVQTMGKEDEEFKGRFLAYTESIARRLEESARTLDMAQLDYLLRCIRDTKDVAFFGVHRCASIIQELQFALTLKDKFIQTYTGLSMQLECIRRLKADSLAMVITAGDDGFLYLEKELLAALRKSPCRKILVTTNRVNPHSDVFHEIHLVGTGAMDSGKYDLMNYSEAMISRYFTKY